MTHSHMNTVNPTHLDGRQTDGRKGLAYDWQGVLREGDVAEDCDAALASPAMSALIGLLLT